MSKNIGLFGLGVVGSGYYQITQKIQQFIPKKVVVKDPHKPRALQVAQLAYEADYILEDETIDLILELISDADEAHHIVSNALEKGINVISANKKLIAENLKELLELQQKHGSKLLYEASVAAGIPIIEVLETHYALEPISKISGILNGSSNFILTKIFEEGISYQEALTEAQKLGYVEANPYLDVSGSDAASKLSILSLHAFGAIIHPDNILKLGIEDISHEAVDLAKSHDAVIKLIATATVQEQAIHAFVLPTFLPKTHELAQVAYEYNGIEITSDYQGEQFYKGKGAGSYATGASVLSDVKKLALGKGYAYNKYLQAKNLHHETSSHIDIYLSSSNETIISKLGIQTREFIRNEEGIQLIGKVSLQSLLENQKAIENNAIFIANISQELAHLSIDRLGEKVLVQR
ncbi:homoserine dehydrogenase [Penaeicola halotolerans]|uniref:homoserine dehydrogenase n=1 Tax=Penaeicola halotolerans TaxID=2793196 RepID=UPI001CF9022A|nr:homoserine dehydrogenase [Penaeicola halotolerans]